MHRAITKMVSLSVLFFIFLSHNARSQFSKQTQPAAYSYYPPQNDTESWQRLYLLLSSTFINVVNEGQVDLNTALHKASRSLGLSRISILAEGFGDADLLKQSQWVDQRDPSKGLQLLTQTTGRKNLQQLLLLGSYYAFEPGQLPRSRDSANHFLTSALTMSRKLKEAGLEKQALCLLGKVCLENNDDKADSIFRLVITMSSEAGDIETEAKAFVYRSRFTPPGANTILQKLEDSQRAAELYRSVQNTEGEINALTDAGYLLTITGQLQPAKEIFQKAYNLCLSIKFPYIHYNAQALSMITTFQGKFGEPLRYTLEMIKVAERCRDSIGWGYFHSNLALMLKSEGRDQEALEISKKAINRFVADRNPTVYNLLTDVVNDMGQSGRSQEALDLTYRVSQQVSAPTTFTDQFFYHYAFANCYINLNRLDLAESHIKLMDSMETKAEIIRGPLRRSAINELIGIVYMKRGKYQEAKQLFEKHFETISIGMRSLPSDLNIYRRLIYTDSLLGDKASAVRHYAAYTKLLDSNFRVTKIRQAEELQVMYQTNEKENEIAMLTQQARLEKLNSDRAILLRNLTFAGIIIALIIVSLLYRQNRLKHKINKIITHKNDQLEGLISDKERLLTDKEWLMKEIHHRVKNNLQIVMSLLNSQSIYMNNDAALNAIHDSRRRVHAMALIHQKLYQTENISVIPMSEYINDLVYYVRDSFNTGDRVVIEQEIESVSLDVSQAIPLGLIINEGLVNAIKYAFPGDRKGVIHVSLNKQDATHLVMSIKDNGIGLLPSGDTRHDNALGIELMKGLARQLNGTFTLSNDNGLEVLIRFMIFERGA